MAAYTTKTKQIRRAFGGLSYQKAYLFFCSTLAETNLRSRLYSRNRETWFWCAELYVVAWVWHAVWEGWVSWCVPCVLNSRTSVFCFCHRSFWDRACRGGHRRDSVTALWCIAVLGSVCLILEGKVRKTSVPMFQRHQGYRWHFNLHLPCSFSTIQKLGLTKVFFINCATSNHHSNQCLYLCLKYNTGLWYQYHCNSVQHLER